MGRSADKHTLFNDPAYLPAGANPDFNAKKLRYSYTSMTTPSSVLEYDFEQGHRAAEAARGAGRHV